MFRELWGFLANAPWEFYAIIIFLVAVCVGLGIVYPKAFAPQAAPDENCSYGLFGLVDNCYNWKCDVNTSICMKSDVGEYCSKSTDCESLLESPLICFNKICQTGLEDSPCETDEHCRQGFYCVANKCETGENGSPCVLDGADCDAGYCEAYIGQPLGHCTTGDVNAPCYDDSVCQYNGLTCIKKICTTKVETGSYCDSDADCTGKQDACRNNKCITLGPLCPLLKFFGGGQNIQLFLIIFGVLVFLAGLALNSDWIEWSANAPAVLKMGLIPGGLFIICIALFPQLLGLAIVC